MYQGRINGFISQGMNPLAALPNKKKCTAALSKLKYWSSSIRCAPRRGVLENYGEFNNVKPEDIKTEVIRCRPMLPTRRPARSPTRPSGAVALGRRRATGRSQDRSRDHRQPVHEAARDVREGRRQVPRPDHEAHVELCESESAERRRGACGKSGGRASPMSSDPKDRRRRWRKAGEQLPGFGMLQDDGSTACGNWIYCGSWSQAGNLTRAAIPTIRAISATT